MHSLSWAWKSGDGVKLCFELKKNFALQLSKTVICQESGLQHPQVSLTSCTLGSHSAKCARVYDPQTRINVLPVAHARLLCSLIKAALALCNLLCYTANMHG